MSEGGSMGIFGTKTHVELFLRKVLKRRWVFPLYINSLLDIFGKNEPNCLISVYQIQEGKGRGGVTSLLHKFGKKLESYVGEGFLAITDNKTLSILIDDIDEASDYIGEFLKESPFGETEAIKKKIPYINQDLKRLINKDLKPFIRDYHVYIDGPEITIGDVGIVPKYIYKNRKVRTIPKGKSWPINSVVVTTTPNNQILSLKLDNVHPNADEDGFFCLSSSFYATLTIETFRDIVNQIRIYNLDDCYWTPDFCK